jgi:ATP-dependent DNA helicase DinG
VADVEGILNTEDVFKRLSEQLVGYEHRSQQLQLALEVERVLKGGHTGVFEAGTGTGKSFAALIPAALSGKKVVVSTNTIALQEQYINKDIPALQKILPFEIEAVLMKGRGNYLGLRRWEEHVLEFGLDERLADWVYNTDEGDVSELDFVPHYETWNEINSDGDDCLRNRCPRFQECFYFETRRRADKANIIVVNHALLLADAASQGNILPKYDVLIVDEAHHVTDVATDAFSLQVSNRGLRALCTRAIKKASAPGGMIHDIEAEGNRFFNHIASMCPFARTRLRQPVEEADDLILSLSLLKGWLEQQTFENILDVDLSREKAKLKAKSIISTISAYIACLELIASPSPEWVLWIEKSDYPSSRVAIVAAPLDPSEYLRDCVLEKEGLESSVWMSATLATGGKDPFEFFKRNIGLGHVVQSRVPSPFNYAQQATLYLPQSMPEPNSPGFLPRAAEEIERILDVTEGRAFVLFTSKAALNASFDLLSPSLAYPCKKQGEMPRAKLIEWFKSTPCAVLFGTSSFWEGVSIDGDQLSCVIIDRIPFQVPDDPIYEARCESLKTDKQRSWFNDLALPYATMRLKQGMGRLIRTSTDRGIVAILDPRLTSKAYGRELLGCLPPMKIVRTLNDLNDAFVGSAKIFVPPNPITVETNFFR